MNSPKHCISRRDFLKAATVAGAATLGGNLGNPAMASQSQATMPTRPFGKTGIDVSILSLGGMFNIASNQLMMKQALRWGVTYWDTAASYQRGSEKGIGKYFNKYPQDRQKVFLVSKSGARDPDGMTESQPAFPPIKSPVGTGPKELKWKVGK